jgi:lysozyme
VTPNGIAILKRLEGFRAKAYQDGGGVYTIGYGHTGGVKAGDTVTEKEAEVLLRADIRDAETALWEVKVPLNVNQRDALVMFIFNVGVSAFEESTLLRKLNSKDFDGAADQFDRWVYDNGEVVQGLVKRRAVEEALFRKPVKPLKNSRTVVGGAGASVGTGGAGIAEAIQQAQEQVNTLTPYLEVAKWVFLALVLAGVAYMLWARYDDWKKGHR